MISLRKILQRLQRPLRDEEGNLVLKKGKKQPDTSLRDTENVPLKEDIKEYFEREVRPFAPDAWVDEKKSKVGYEIPFTRYFYKYGKKGTLRGTENYGFRDRTIWKS